MDVAIRSGTNNLHGTLYEFVRNDALWNANNFFTNRSAPLGFDSDGNARKPVRRYNRFGGTIGGPIYLPRFGEGGPAVYKGENRSFFFASYEGIRTSTPKSDIITVPTVSTNNATTRASTWRRTSARCPRGFPGCERIR